MDKPTVRTVGICVGHSLNTRPLKYYNVAEVDAYIAHLEAGLASEEGKLAAAHIVRDSWKDRAWTAEEQLAELAKQPPVGEAVNIGGVIMVEWERCISDGTQLFTRAAPAINLAELVEASANKDADEIIHLFDGVYDDRSRAWSLANDVWDACHAAILRNIEHK